MSETKGSTGGGAKGPSYRAIVTTAPGKLEMRDRPMPEPAAGQVRIRVGACGICATDIAIMADGHRIGFDGVLGHEWAGTVDAVGTDGDAGLVGRRCVAENVLSDGGEVGFEHDGGYGQYLITEADNLCPLPDDFAFDTAALIEPLAVVVRGARRMRADVAQPILILGDGPIGLLMLMLLRQQGAEQATLVGGRDRRLALARELGAVQTLNYHELGADLEAAIGAAAGCKFPAIVEASGAASAAAAAVPLAATGGKILIIGEYGRTHAEFAWNRLLIQELELIGSNASADAWPEAVRLAVEEGLPLDKLITTRLPAEQFQRGIDVTRADRDTIKVVLQW